MLPELPVDPFVKIKPPPVSLPIVVLITVRLPLKVTESAGGGDTLKLGVEAYGHVVQRIEVCVPSQLRVLPNRKQFLLF